MSSAVRCLALWLLAASSMANACMVEPRAYVLSNIDAAYWRYDAVFVGEVVGLAPIDSSWDNVTIRVIEQFRDNVDEQVSLPVYTRNICRPNTALGTRYIVFAGRPIFDMNSIQHLRGHDPTARPPAPWNGNFILSVTVEVDSTYAPYLERMESVLAKLRALRADYEEE